MSLATQNLPLSVIIKSKDNEEPKKKSREDWRKAKELEEARKAGTAPAAVDEEGKDINPHIPQYIASSPWYFGAVGPTLKHQRPQEDKQKKYSSIDEWYSRGIKTFTATKYRKGSCENCGAMTHKKKDCMERPRRVGAKYTGDAIAPDEFMQQIYSHDYDGKRDRWNGYDPEEHKAVFEEYAKIEEAKRQLKAEKLQEDLLAGEAKKDTLSKADNDNDLDDEDKYADDIDMPGTKVDSKQRITVRNLRIREDTAKYLRNLDPNSAYYDPKTRSMRDNPYKTSGKNPDVVQFAGDNFVRCTGDTIEMARAQMFAWEAYDRGVDVHLQAEPTKLELLQHQFEVKKEEFKHQLKGSILERYGGEKHLDAPPKQLLLAQTEDYVEYSRHGRVIKGQEKAVIRSKYEEDVYINNHKSVWGSYWKDGKWGYKCCHSFTKQSYCTGEAGKDAEADGIITVILPRNHEADNEFENEEPQKSLLEIHHEKLQEQNSKKKKRDKKKKKLASRKKKKKVDSSSDDSSSESDNEEIIKKEKLRQALEAEEDRIREVDRLLAMDERKRPYNSMYDVKEPTEEEMEAYTRKRLRDDDPMAQFLGR